MNVIFQPASPFDSNSQSQGIIRIWTGFSAEHALHWKRLVQWRSKPFTLSWILELDLLDNFNRKHCNKMLKLKTIITIDLFIYIFIYLFIYLQFNGVLKKINNHDDVSLPSQLRWMKMVQKLTWIRILKARKTKKTMIKKFQEMIKQFCSQRAR